MSLDKLEECKKNIQNIGEMSFNAYILNFNNLDEITEYTSYKLKFDKDILQQISLSMVECFINLIKKKNFLFEDYDGYNNKISVDKINIENELISENWKNLLSSIENYNEFKSFNIKSNSFFVEIGNNTNDNIYLIIKQSPLNIFKKQKNIFKVNDFTVENTEDKLIRFPKSTDIIIYKDIMYNINYNFEDIFGINNSIKCFCKKNINHLISSEIVYFKDNINIEKFFDKKKVYKRFLTYSETKIPILLQEDKRKYIKEKLNIDFNSDENQYILDSDEKIDNFTKIISGKIHKDFFNDNLLEVSSSKQIIIKNKE